MATIWILLVLLFSPKFAPLNSIRENIPEKSGLKCQPLNPSVPELNGRRHLMQPTNGCIRCLLVAHNDLERSTEHRRHNLSHLTRTRWIPR